MTKELLLIDFDGTLCHDRFWRSADSETNHKIQKYLFGTDKRVVVDWMKGAYTSEQINEILARELDLDYEYIWSLFIRDCQTMRIEDEILTQISRLRSRFTTMLVTDNMDCFNRFTVPALMLDRYFDQIINSCEERVFKNDNGGKIFSEIASRNETRMSDAILVDNSKSSCDIFETLGGSSCFVTKEQPLTYWLKTLTSS